MRTEAGKMPESLIFLTENNPGVSNDRFGFNCFSIIIEMQASSQKSYRERAIYYSGKALSRQGIPGEGWDFERLAAVYSINFLNFVLLGKFRSDILLIDRDTQQVFSTKQRFIFLEFPLFRKKEQECKTDFERWIYILKHMETLNRIGLPGLQGPDGLCHRRRI